MKRLIIMAGLPGSGKSTFVKNYLNEGLVFHIDSDETRRKMYGTYLYFPKNMYDIYDQMIVDGIKIYNENIDKDFTMIMDSTFLDNYRRNYYLKKLPKFDENILIMFKSNDINFNFRNNKLRIKDKWVPEDVILNMVKEYEEPNEETIQNFDKIYRIVSEEIQY